MAALLQVIAQGCCQRCADLGDQVDDLKLKTEWAMKPASDEQLVMQSYIPTPARHQAPGATRGREGARKRRSSPFFSGQRGIRFSMQVEKTEKQRRLGVALEAAKNTADIVVTAVDDDGLFGEWNKAKPASVIQTGDLIFEVNGKRGDVKQMFNVLKTESLLDIQIRRP
eukprot:TRINITY_DN16212_c0_g1_i1.p1 TRINITY_DN16212_c0_g1~~TRINITY_DN16212_c0_g1_i1.p1  ORF type:complete len:169 (+),score=35.34 TRINITY_DN16212_c0_g1_i1:35-541(+)